MGKLKREHTEWTEKKIQERLQEHFMSYSNVRYFAENLYIYDYESDLWIMTKSGLSYEFEIKISRADFRNDFRHKQKKHARLRDRCGLSHNDKPNYFYYAVPEGLIAESEVPEYAGLIYMTEVFPYHTIVRRAPRLMEEKNDIGCLNLIDKFYYNMLSQKRNCIDLRRNLTRLTQKMDELTGKPDNEKPTYMKLLQENESLRVELEEIKQLKRRYIDTMITNQELMSENRRLKKQLNNNDNGNGKEKSNSDPE